MKRALLAVLLLAGCATQKTVYLPDGRQGHSISCDGAALSWDLCFNKAGEICKERGYEVLAQQGEDSPLITSSQYGTMAGSVVKRTLVIACKD